MLKCDRCNEHYEYSPTMVQGKRNHYLLCPLCSYDLRCYADTFVNMTPENLAGRKCGHIIAYIKDLRKRNKKG